MDLVMNIIKIVKVFSCFEISKFDYYLLFIACYLHDISMVRIASKDDFLLGGPETDNIANSLENSWNGVKDRVAEKKAMVGPKPTRQINLWDKKENVEICNVI